MNMSVTPETRASVKAMNAAGVGRSEGAVVDLAVEDLAKYHAKKGGKA